jgi:hypothetical protein
MPVLLRELPRANDLGTLHTRAVTSDASVSSDFDLKNPRRSDGGERRWLLRGRAGGSVSVSCCEGADLDEVVSQDAVSAPVLGRMRCAVC